MKAKSCIKALSTVILKATASSDFNLRFVYKSESTQPKSKTQQTEHPSKPLQSCSSARRASRSKTSPSQAAHPAPGRL